MIEFTHLLPPSLESIHNLSPATIDLQSIADHLPDKLPFSGVIAFQTGEGTIVKKAHCPQQAEFSWEQPFNVLSVGKLFTATSIMQIIADEKKTDYPRVTLQTSLSDLLTGDELDLPLKPPYLWEKPDPEALKTLREHAHEITVEHLLTHRSGLGPIHEEDAREGFSPEKIGTFNYSNYGYQLLARVIGKYSKNGSSQDHETGFRNHIECRIFGPAGMETAIQELHTPSPSLDRFKVFLNGNREKVESPEPYPHGNGCFRMSAKDLLAFQKALHQNLTLISTTDLKTMVEHSPRPLGFMRDGSNTIDNPIIGYGHPGNGPGMSSFLWTWSKRDGQPITGVALSNYSTPLNQEGKFGEDAKLVLDPVMYSK